MSEQIKPAARWTKPSWRIVALLLIGIGMLMLIGSTGLFDNAAWDVLWPLAFIAVGVDLVTQGRQRRKVITGTLLAALIFVPLMSMSRLVGGDGAAIERDHENAPLVMGHDIDRVRATISLTVGRLSIDDLRDSDGQIVDLDGGGTITSFSRQGRLGVFDISADSFSEKDLDLRFRRDLPLDLTINIDAGDAQELNFEHLRLEHLDLNMGVGSNALIKLPEEGVIEARINGSASDVRIEAPHDLPTRIEIDASMSDITVDSRFEKDGPVYLSRDYNDEEDHLVIYITSTGGNVIVR